MEWATLILQKDTEDNYWLHAQSDSGLAAMAAEQIERGQFIYNRNVGVCSN